MRPHNLTVQLCLLLFLLLIQHPASAQQRKPPTGGRIAVVVDERLAALRSTPNLSGKLVRRLGRGRLVAITGTKTTLDGITFYRVNVTTRTRGWIQRESVVSPSRASDDQRLFDLIQQSHGFDRIARCRIFLDHFLRSPLRPAVLLLIGDTAESLAADLSKSISRKLTATTLTAPAFTYYLNHPSLDRYNRQNINFLFNPTTKRLHYDGHAWRLLLRQHPHSPEAAEARKRLLELKRNATSID
ncbi:MAG TPA: SH3 domain-containing protein [Pyrinomonadaceae bacterium]|nr:SH3 domain-containing protein [Pyrinomonadaceae bacterium]